MMAPSNPAGLRVLERLGADDRQRRRPTRPSYSYPRCARPPISRSTSTSSRPTRSAASYAATRSGDLIAVGAPLYAKFGLRNCARSLPVRRAPRRRCMCDRSREGPPRGGRARVAAPARARARAVGTARARPRHPAARATTVLIGGGSMYRKLLIGALVAAIAVTAAERRTRGAVEAEQPRSSRSGTTTAPRATPSRPRTWSRPSRSCIPTSRSTSSASRRTTTSRCCRPRRSRTPRPTSRPCGPGCSTSSTRSSCSTSSRTSRAPRSSKLNGIKYMAPDFNTANGFLVMPLENQFYIGFYNKALFAKAGTVRAADDVERALRGLHEAEGQGHHADDLRRRHAGPGRRRSIRSTTSATPMTGILSPAQWRGPLHRQDGLDVAQDRRRS